MKTFEEYLEETKNTITKVFIKIVQAMPSGETNETSHGPVDLSLSSFYEFIKKNLKTDSIYLDTKGRDVVMITLNFDYNKKRYEFSISAPEGKDYSIQIGKEGETILVSNKKVEDEIGLVNFLGDSIFGIEPEESEEKEEPEDDKEKPDKGEKNVKSGEEEL